MERDSDSAPRPQHAGPQHAGPGAAGQPGTGDGRVDQALAPLADLGGLPVDEHPAVFEQVHGGLTAALGTLDSGPDMSGASGPRGTSDPSITPGS